MTLVYQCSALRFSLGDTGYAIPVQQCRRTVAGRPDRKRVFWWQMQGIFQIGQPDVAQLDRTLHKYSPCDPSSLSVTRAMMALYLLRQALGQASW